MRTIIILKNDSQNYKIDATLNLDFIILEKCCPKIEFLLYVSLYLSQQI